MVDVGVIGLGQMGVLHSAICNALPNGRVSAICEADARLNHIMAKLVPTIHFYKDYVQMVDSESLQAIFICTPAPTHAPLLLGLKSRTKRMALFVEKPLATTAEDARQVANEFERSNYVTMVGFQKRFAGPFRKAKEFLDQQILGELAFFRGHFFGPPNFGESSIWRFKKGGGGVCLEFGPHVIDLLLWFFGDPNRVEHASKSMFSTEVEDYAHILLEYENGLVGHADLCWSMRNFDPGELMVEVHGKYGTMNVTEDRLILHLDKDSVLPAGVHLLHASQLTPQLPYQLANPEHVLEDVYFLNCIESNTQPETNFGNAAKVNSLIDTIVS